MSVMLTDLSMNLSNVCLQEISRAVQLRPTRVDGNQANKHCSGGENYGRHCRKLPSDDPARGQTAVGGAIRSVGSAPVRAQYLVCSDVLGRSERGAIAGPPHPERA